MGESELLTKSQIENIVNDCLKTRRFSGPEIDGLTVIVQSCVSQALSIVKEEMSERFHKIDMTGKDYETKIAGIYFRFDVMDKTIENGFVLVDKKFVAFDKTIEDGFKSVEKKFSAVVWKIIVPLFLMFAAAAIGLVIKK